MSWESIDSIRVVAQEPSHIYAAHMAAAPRFSNGGTAPSLHMPIGRLDINQELLDQARTEIERDRVSIDEYIEMPAQPEALTRKDHTLSPSLEAFLIACANRLSEAAQQDLREHVGFEPFEQAPARIVVTPSYSQPPLDVWHRDADETLILDPSMVGFAYLTTLLGPSTEFASGNYANADFVSDLFRYPEHIQNNTVLYPPCTITVHDENFTLHQAPLARPGVAEPRIFMDFRVQHYVDAGAVDE